MKKILRSLVVLGVVLATVGTSSLAYFTSNVSATGNLITTGSLRLAIDSTAFGGGNSGYVVAYDNGGTVNLVAPFPTITNMVPGETRSVYVTVRNIGTVPFDYRANFSGSWGDGGLDAQNVMTVDQVHRYPTGNCSANIECEDIYYWLTGGPAFNHIGTLTDFGSLGVVNAVGSAYFGHPNAVSNGVDTLLPNQFSIFKVDFKMNEAAGNDFQNKTFTYSMNAMSKQINAPSF